MTSVNNKTIYNVICSDYTQTNILFIGCSLANEPDLEYIFSQAKEDISSNILRCIIRTNKLTIDEEFDLEEYRINAVIIVNDYELFYREFISEYEEIAAQDAGTKYQFTNPQIVKIDSDDKSLNIKFLSGKNIFDPSKNQFYKSNLQVMGECIANIEIYWSNNNSVIIRRRLFSGKTVVLNILA